MKAVIVVKMKDGYLVIPGSDPFISNESIQDGRVIEKSYNMSGLGTAIESLFKDEDERIIPTPVPVPLPVREAKDDLPF